MGESELRAKIAKINKGTKIAVVPVSTEFGDEITAIGLPCAPYERATIELPEPFYASLEEFDGDTLWLRTKSYYCIKVAIADIRDVIPLNGDLLGTEPGTD